MKRLLYTILFACALAANAAAQEYIVPEIKVSQDKVRVNGESYYAHVVTEKQTLYSISKAYGVKVDAIYEANANLHLDSEGLKIGQVILIPMKQEGSAAAEAKNEAKAAGMDSRAVFPGMGAHHETLPPQPESPADSSSVEGFELDIPSSVNLALILPFSSGGRVRENCLEFYSGALLAAKNLGEQGISLNINAIDCKAPGTNLSTRALSQYDVLIGPTDTLDIKKILRNLPHDKYLVSPLEPKSAVFADLYRLIQAPTPVNVQNEEVVSWAISEMAPGDSLVLIREKGRKLSSNTLSIINALNSSRIKYKTISYALLEGLEIQDSFMAHAAAPGHTTRYIIASEDESFTNDALRNINLMLYKKYDVALYAPSRLSRYATIETENLHNVNTHLCATYFTDYSREDVKHFVLAYRALFNAEPGQFAMHGYDVVNYFGSICSVYGRQWAKRLPDYPAGGIQTAFHFGKYKGKGNVNDAIIRVLYTPDFKLQAVR